MEEVGKILPSILSRHLHRGNLRLVEVLTALWSPAVGKGIAQHTKPVAFVSGTLTLATACPSWAAQLGLMSEELRAEINSFLGRAVVRKLRVCHLPSLVLENGSPESETANRRFEPRESKLAGASSKPTFELASLDPEIARFVEDSFAKYFCKAPNRQVGGARTVTGLVFGPAKSGNLKS